MKKIKIFIVLLCAALLAASCENFFEVDLKDQATLDEVFSQSNTTHNYLAQLYSHIPLDEEIIGSHGWVVARSDEAMYSFKQWVNYLTIRSGNYSSSTGAFNYWSSFYVGINQCSIFMANVDKDQEDTEQTRTTMKAEARFLRTYYYFCLFRQYGPVFFWGDQLSDEKIKGAEIDRNTVDENIDFIVSELDKAAADLPLRIEDVGEQADRWMGRATKGAALALKSRVLLMAASPLYNGCDLYKGKMRNKDGKYLFPQTPDPEKWERAAQAARELINLGIYSLCTSDKTGDAFKDGTASYQKVFFEPWNSETIWGWWRRTSSAYSWLGGTGAIITVAMPPRLNGILYGYGGVAPSLKLVDSYAMWESGRYPVLGYEGQNDYSRPVVDPESGYSPEGFTEDYKQPVDADWAPAFKAHNSTIGREPRYYACLVPNGFYFPSKSIQMQFTCYSGAECTSSFSSSTDALYVGYVWRKYYPTDTPLKAGTDYTSLKSVYPAFRLDEVYLNYAEACNEKPDRDEATALEYVNKVRNRVGLKNIEEAYPEIRGNKELLRWCIQKERMIEFGMDAMRHYDACRWMVAKAEYPTMNWTLNLKSTNYEDSYRRVTDVFGGDPAVFADRDYLFPINSNQLSEMTNLTQNYGF